MIEKMILKVDLVDGKPKVTLGTGHTAVLSLALQVADLAVKEQIMIQDEIKTLEDAPKILKPDSELTIPASLNLGI